MAPTIGTPRALALGVCCFALSIASPAFGQAVLVEIEGATAGDTLGHAVSDVGDVDNDGFDDYIVSSKLEKVNGVPAGVVRVYSGKSGLVIHTFSGVTSAEWFGWSVSSVGDLDNDGHAEVLIGAPHDDTLITDGGAAHVYDGATGLPMYSFYGPNYEAWFGYSVADAGDVNNDGTLDMVVGGWRDGFNGSDSGVARVYSGTNGAQLYEWYGDASGDELGFSVAGAGDTDQDGWDDIIVATLDIDTQVLDGGGARLFSGQTGGILNQFYGDDFADWYGYVVRGAGDLNGDGYGDVLASAPRDDNIGDDSGMFRVFSGFDYSLLLQIDGPVKSQFGWCVDPIEDINGDQVIDYVVGLPRYLSYRGQAQIVSGADGMTLQTYDAAAPSYFGYYVSTAGDTNGNGEPDVLIGAPFDDSVGNNAGRMELITPICGSGTAYSVGCPGDGGFTPWIKVAGCPTSNNVFQLGVEDGLGGSLAFLFFGIGQAPFVIGGGCALDVAPQVGIVVSLPLGGAGPGNGSITLNPLIPADFPPPYALNMAAAVIDPAAAGGYSTTGGLTLEVR